MTDLIRFDDFEVGRIEKPVEKENSLVEMFVKNMNEEICDSFPQKMNYYEFTVRLPAYPTKEEFDEITEIIEEAGWEYVSMIKTLSNEYDLYLGFIQD